MTQRMNESEVETGVFSGLRVESRAKEALHSGENSGAKNKSGESSSRGFPGPLTRSVLFVGLYLPSPYSILIPCWIEPG